MQLVSQKIAKLYDIKEWKSLFYKCSEFAGAFIECCL